MNRLKLVLSLLVVLTCVRVEGTEPRRGVGVKLKVGRESIPLYSESHALVIGASDYTSGWPSLKGVKTDVDEVSRALRSQGFNTHVVMNPTRAQLDQTLRNFVGDYGQTPSARLLIYFAGHGHTLTTTDGRQLGYIVPVDAPRPSQGAGAFKKVAMSMTDIETIALQIESKHVLFLFDSCFSGSIFAATRAVPDDISEKTSKPVRQFITAGSADQTVPDVSIFRAQFVEGIGGEADYNHDQYVTGSELGEYLQSNVTNYSHRSQTPEYGKLSRPGLDKGDFVFDLASRNSVDAVRDVALLLTKGEGFWAKREFRLEDYPILLKAPRELFGKSVSGTAGSNDLQTRELLEAVNLFGGHAGSYDPQRARQILARYLSEPAGMMIEALGIEGDTITTRGGNLEGRGLNYEALASAASESLKQQASRGSGLASYLLVLASSEQLAEIEDGAEIDSDPHMRYMLAAALGGVVPAATAVGAWLRERGENPALALEWLKLGAEMGTPAGQLEYAILLSERGDLAAARSWARKAFTADPNLREDAPKELLLPR